jgi:hypothetical protein
LHGGGLGHVLFFHHLDAGHLLELGGGLGLRLVVAKVVARADVDHAHGQRFCAKASGLAAEGAARQARPGF